MGITRVTIWVIGVTNLLTKSSNPQVVYWGLYLVGPLALENPNEQEGKFRKSGPTDFKAAIFIILIRGIG